MSTLDTIATSIIKEQELVIGPLAWNEAQKVPGISIDAGHVAATVGEHPQLAIDMLIAQYERLFGRASREVCKEAAAPFIPQLAVAEIPSSLRVV